MDSREAKASVLISGAGPSGLVLALALLKNGVTVRIIDKSSQPQVGQRGAAIQPRLLELYNLLGVLPDIMQASCPLQTVKSYEMPLGTKVIQSLSVAQEMPSPDVPYPNVVMIGQDKEEAILRRHLNQRYHTNVEFGTCLIGFEQDRDGVTIRLCKDHSEEVTRTAWLVGCDGAKSTVRQHLGIPLIKKPHQEHRFIVGDVHIKSGLSRAYSHRWGNYTSNGIGLRPSECPDDTLFQYIVTGSEVDYDRLLSDHDALLQHISNGIGSNRVEFAGLITVQDWRPKARIADRLSDNRVFIVGDAAHVHPSSGGQGITSSVQDSMNLAWKLALVIRGLAPQSLLSTYNEERRPVALEMINISATVYEYVLSGSATPWTGTNLQQLRQLGVNYRWSSIAVDDSTDRVEVISTYGAGCGTLRAGDRAPEAPGLVNVISQEDTSVFRNLSSSKHTALIFANSIHESVPFSEVLNICPSGIVQQILILPSTAIITGSALFAAGSILKDRKGHAYATYVHDSGPHVVVVRPDGIVGANVRRTESLRRFLGLIFNMKH